MATVAAFAAAMPAASGDHACNTVVVDLKGAYVISDQPLVGSDGGPFSLWIYAETNGIAGLQRGGTTLLGDVDVCQLYPDPDQGIF